ncbi:MAG: hypothetical protein ACOZQL_25390 [Myxococcota bacterium]
MRFFLVFSLPLFACSPGMTADFTLKGTFASRPVDLSASLTSGGAGLSDGTNKGDNRNTANQLAMIGGQTAWTSVRTTTCPTEPCPDNVELVLWTPPAIIHAGPWVLPEGSEVSLYKDLDLLATEPIAGLAQLDFEPPEFSAAGRVTLRQRAKLGAGPRMAGLTVEGSVGLEYQCFLQNTYFRHCGEAIRGDGQTNPLKLPYAENTCPRELVAPYEASPTWNGLQLSLGDLKVDCRETEGTLNGGKKPVLCHSKRTVEAGGCTWTVHFLTDGALYQFAIAGWADAGCAQKTCNTYR